jgi:hypothetical protein
MITNRAVRWIINTILAVDLCFLGAIAGIIMFALTRFASHRAANQWRTFCIEVLAFLITIITQALSGLKIEFVFSKGICDISKQLSIQYIDYIDVILRQSRMIVCNYVTEFDWIFVILILVMASKFMGSRLITSRSMERIGLTSDRPIYPIIFPEGTRVDAKGNRDLALKQVTDGIGFCATQQPAVPQYLHLLPPRWKMMYDILKEWPIGQVPSILDFNIVYAKGAFGARSSSRLLVDQTRWIPSIFDLLYDNSITVQLYVSLVTVPKKAQSDPKEFKSWLYNTWTNKDQRLQNPRRDVYVPVLFSAAAQFLIVSMMLLLFALILYLSYSLLCNGRSFYFLCFIEATILTFLGFRYGQSVNS